MSVEAERLYQKDDRGLDQFKHGDLPFCFELIELAQAFYRIGKICQLKSLVFKGLNDPLKVGEWIQIPFMMFNFLIRDLMNMSSMDTELFEDILRRHVHSCLTYVMYDISNPNGSTIGDKSKYFQLLFVNLSFKRKNPEYYIEGAIRQFSMDLEDVIPFLQFFIEHCESDLAQKNVNDAIKLKKSKQKRLKGWVSEVENWDWILEDRRKSMISYKNSVQIMQHFKIISK